MHTWGSDQNLWGYRTTGNPHDIEELKEPVHTHELRLPANEDIRGFLQFSGDLIEAEAHIDDTRNQRDGEDSINEKILLPRQKARRINGENPDEESGLGTDRNEIGEKDKSLDTAHALGASDKAIYLQFVSPDGQLLFTALLTAFTRVTPPNVNAHASAHALRIKTGFFQRCELVKMRAMLIGIRAPSQKALRIMSLSCPRTAVLEDCAEPGDRVEVVPFAGLQDEFMVRERPVFGRGFSLASWGKSPGRYLYS